jgi:hypothetical protein
LRGSQGIDQRRKSPEVQRVRNIDFSSDGIVFIIKSDNQLGGCPRIGIFSQIEAFVKNMHRHIVNIPSIIFLKQR